MTRLTVCVEGVEFGNGYILAPGSVQMPEYVIPVCWQNNWDKFLGAASDMRREDNKISMEIKLNSDVFLNLEDGIGASLFLSPVDLNKDSKLIVRGRVRAVALSDI